MKPKIIIETFYENCCIHLMVRIDDKSQLKSLLKYLNLFLLKRKTREILKHDFSDILGNQSSFSSNRIADKIATIDYLLIDKGPKQKVAFIYMVITTSRKDFSRVSSFNIVDYFEP